MKIKTIYPKSDHTLEIVANDGRIGIFDVAPYLKYEAFSALKDETAFMKISNGGYFIEWDCGADLSADTIEARWTQLNCHSKGFTLMEVLIAMAIFAIGILGVAKLQITSTGENTTSRTMTEGATVAVGSTEQLLVYDYDDTTNLAEGTHTPEVITGASGVEYTVTTTINDDTPMKNVKQINITVSWSDKGTTKTFAMTTYKAQEV